MNLPSNTFKIIESFALDFTRLIRGVRVYPSKHPTLIGVAERIIASLHFDSAGLFTIGVTPTELIVSGDFISGKATRLARILHTRRVLRMLWTKAVGVEDLWTFARLLSTPKLEGAELRRKLHSEGVYAIDLEPLDLEEIHSGIADQVVDPKISPEERSRTAWLILMSHETSPEQIAWALSSEEFWENATTDWTDAGYGDSKGFADLLLNLEERFEAALSLLPDSQRAEVFDNLAKMGKNLSIPDLIRLLAREGKDPGRMGDGIVSLFRDIDGEHLIDLLAGLAAGGDKGAGRVAEAYRHFNPATGTDNLISLVKSRISLGDGSGFTVEVWKTVEKLILGINENPFMDPEYSESLEHLVDAPVPEPDAKEQPELAQNPADHLDKVILGLAAEGQERWFKKLLERIETHVEESGVFRALGFIRLVDDVRPELLDSVPLLVKKLFRKGLCDLTKANSIERQNLGQFALRHEGALVDSALKALTEEERISGRYFLVTLLASFSPAATPAFVAKARKGPWYVSRNLAIVLGQQGVPCSAPTLRILSNHDHPKVRREALRALRRLEGTLNLGSDSSILQTEESGYGQEINHFLNQPGRMDQAGVYG